jgi:hypothetical protein
VLKHKIFNKFQNGPKNENLGGMLAEIFSSGQEAGEFVPRGGL